MAESRLWEVFIKPRRGLFHQHVGSVHAADARTALSHARDLHAGHAQPVSSIWVVPSEAVRAGSPDADADPMC